MTSWDPAKYLRFGDERTRPSHDLVARIRIDAPRTVIDLGCGPGNSTQVLRQRWPDARVTGLDNSPHMIAAARTAHPDQEWLLGDMQLWESGDAYDVVFSNAALQWARDQAALVQRWFRQVTPGGALAFQMPSGRYAPVRQLMERVAGDPAWTSRMDAARRALTMEEPHVYYDALATIARSIDMWETEYYHVLESPAAIVDWMSGTGLRPFLDALATPDERVRFTTQLTGLVEEAYSRRADGRVLFPFRRLFLIAYA
jgi:trans-aconitate 2-methyltransferase